MAALMLENLKLIILFLLIGSIIGLSHLTGENLTKLKHAFHSRRWRDIGSITAQLLEERKMSLIAHRNLKAVKLLTTTGRAERACGCARHNYCSSARRVRRS